MARRKKTRCKLKGGCSYGPRTRKRKQLGEGSMATYRLRVWTGPVGVVEWGRKLRRAGLKVPTTGTEHVTVDVKAIDCTDATIKMSDALRRKYKKDFGLRPASCARRPRSR